MSNSRPWQIRLHRSVGRAARLAGPYKTLLEMCLLIGGMVFAIIFVSRTWGYPSASLLFQTLGRVPYTDQAHRVIVQASFAIGDSSNIRIDKLVLSCRTIEPVSEPCLAECPDSEASVIAGTLPRGDAKTWACLFTVPPTSCALMSISIHGHAEGLNGGSAHWDANTVSCPNAAPE